MISRRNQGLRTVVLCIAALLYLAPSGCNPSSRATAVDSGSSKDGLSPGACPAGSHNLNCPCETVDEAVACCKGGTQVCTRVGEFAAWGHCRASDGTPLDCSTTCDTSGEFGCDLGATTVDMTPTVTCQCVVGATRWCDEPNFCSWGKQTCGPDSKWGTCVEAGMQPAGCQGFTNVFYDQDCCVKAGLCCQDYNNPTNPNSLGMCAGFVTCQ